LRAVIKRATVDAPRVASGSVAGDENAAVGKGVTQRITNQWVVIHNEEREFIGHSLNAISVKYFTQL
jgi:hypothetical protein